MGEKKEDFNEEDIRRCYKFLEHLNETEVRVLDAKKIEPPKSIFLHSENEFVKTCLMYNGKYNLYAGINEREKNGTSKENVISVKTLVLDIDAVREKGFEKEPATDLELKGAEEICDKILLSIAQTKQPAPVKLCSGNGYQLWFAIPEIKIDNVNRQDIEDKLQLFQDLIKSKFDINGAIDKIGDLPRIIKIWGTLNVKGKESEGRNYRVAKVIGDYWRNENEELKEQILKLEKPKQEIEYEPLSEEDFDLSKLPPCINHLLKFYENKDGSYWFRIIQFFASFFMCAGLKEDKTLKIILQWNKKQPYHETDEEIEIQRIIGRIYKNNIKIPNCKKIKSETGGFPYFGLAELKLCKSDSKCNKCINPIIRYKRDLEETDKIEEATGIFLDKRELAKRFLKIQPLFYDKGRLWWIWQRNEMKWEIIDETDVLNSIEKNSKSNTINTKERNEILEALKQEGRKNIPKPMQSSWLQFQNEIIDIVTGEKFEASPEYFATNPIPYKLHNDNFEATPVMDKIFEEWVGKDYVQTLYEIIAYCLLPAYPLHRLFCFVGAGLNGKGCFLRLLEKFIGKDNVISTELDTLINSRFEVTKLHKKLVCMMGETNFQEISKTSMLKKLTGGDLIGFEYKNKNPFDDYNYAKIIIATNNLPETTDKTMGFYRRWLIIDFPNQFSEQKDILAEIPEEEYESLALKCTGILKDLLKKRAFHNEGSIEERMKRFEDRSNFLSKFIRENCSVDNPNSFLTINDFKRKFQSWCVEHKVRILSDTTIGKAMKEHGFEQGIKYGDWMCDGKYFNARVWYGIQWKV